MNRRNWLKISGISGAATLVTGKVISMPVTNPLPSINQQDDIIRLSSNENPYGPSKKVREAMMNAFDAVCRYPFSYFAELKKMLADKHGVKSHQIVLTGGSMEGLRATGLAYGLNGGEIVSADPVYKAMLIYAENIGAYIHRVPLTKDLGHDLAAMEQRITLSTKLVFVCNPNNPTGTLIPAKELENFCLRVSDRTMVFSDEAYMDYIKDPDYPSMVSLVKKGKNVIVSRTFSKVYGLAGIRIGYLVARRDIAKRLQKFVMAAPNVLAVYAAIEALKDTDFYHFSLEKTEQGKQKIYRTLTNLELRHVPSHTNFVFFRTERPITEVQQDFLSESVKVGRAFPPFTDWCRVSIGTLEEVDKFCEAANAIF